MEIGNQILNIRKEQQLTQEEFGRLFHVTRQTVSNWENEKSYPDLQTLIRIFESAMKFCVSLDTILKEDIRMVKKIDGYKNYKKSFYSFDNVHFSCCGNSRYIHRHMQSST
mgnify:CR=1 FL=1